MGLIPTMNYYPLGESPPNGNSLTPQWKNANKKEINHQIFIIGSFDVTP